MDASQSKEKLIELAHYRMPFGKFKDRHLIDLPEAYLIWFKQNGFPDGKLGQLMASALEIKINGLESLLHKIREDFPRPFR